MTDEQDAQHALLNGAIAACGHPIVVRNALGVCCGICHARFEVVLHPRKARPRVPSHDEELTD